MGIYVPLSGVDGTLASGALVIAQKFGHLVLGPRGVVGVETRDETVDAHDGAGGVVAHFDIGVGASNGVHAVASSFR